MRNFERLKAARETIGVNQTEFANTLGVAPSFISGIERDKKDVSRELLEKLIEKYHINANWILTGEGEMFLSQKPEVTAKTVFEIPLLTKEQLLSFEPEKEIPFGERKANSGDYPDLAYIPIPMRVMEYSTDLRAAVAFDSRMAPVIRSGDIAIFEATGWNGDGIYIYRMGSGLHIGYVGNYGDTFHLFNEWKDDEQPYDADTFRAIGRVRAVVSDLLGKDWKGGKQPLN
jgi:transcriptional regulator with XRE-family HTH domain